MDKLILCIIGIFFVIGCIDYVLGCPLKLGKEFEAGIKTMGALAFGMIGIYSLAPIFTKLLSSSVIPLCNAVNLDPSIFTSSFIAVDMGGFQIANKVALSSKIGLFSGIIVASSLGATISFSIPIALSMISKDDEKLFAKGIMIGLVSIPLGCLAAGLYEGINLYLLLVNLIPIFLLTMILGIGLLKAPKILVKLFSLFGKLIILMSILGLLLQGTEILLNVKLISGLAPISESATIVCKIAFVLGGAYPMLAVIKYIFKNSLGKIGNKLGINSASVAGLIGNLASNLIIFGTYDKMDSKGKVMCTALSVSCAFVFGGQLGFVAGAAPKMITAYIISKFTSGIVSIILANILYTENAKDTKIIRGVTYEN